jgi:hypothetical protein
MYRYNEEGYWRFNQPVTFTNRRHVPRSLSSSVAHCVVGFRAAGWQGRYEPFPLTIRRSRSLGSSSEAPVVGCNDDSHAAATVQ